MPKRTVIARPLVVVAAVLAVLGLTTSAWAGGTEKAYYQGRCSLAEIPEAFTLGGTVRFQFDGSPDQYESLRAKWVVSSRLSNTNDAWLPIRTVKQIADPANWILSYDANPPIRWDAAHEYKLAFVGRYVVAGQPDVRFRVARIAMFSPGSDPVNGCKTFAGTRL
jgi:hypothetical protein